MKIICTVEIINRSLPTLGIKPSKALRSSLTIGKGPDKEVYLTIQNNESSNFKKYKVKNNVAQVFVRFVNEGKATIRLKQPELDLALKCDPIPLKGFLKTLKLCLEGSSSFQIETHALNFSQKTILKAPKTKLKIETKEDFPVLEGFPRTLEYLQINKANQKYFDSRILRLRNLKILNFNNNSLTSLPEQIGSSLPNLAELHLAENSLGQGNDWKWIVNPSLRKTLKLLDLRSNELTFLHERVIMLNNLVTLMVDRNSLSSLPEGLGCMKNLRFLSGSENNLTHLPGSVFMLRLDTLDCSKNPFSRSYSTLRYADFQNVSSLLDLAASCVIRKRLTYSPTTLPLTLIEHLQSASFCLCGKPCFSQQPFTYIRYQNHHGTSTTVISSQNSIISVAVRYCSFQCYSKQVT